MFKTLTAWGNFPKKKVQILNDIENDSITYGNGRSYGDSALSDKVYINTKKGILNLNQENKIITVYSGTTLDDILNIIVPLGLFLPTTPGTKFITVGGAVASDVHGKNHHIGGSFGNYVLEMTLNLNGTTITLSPEVESDLFFATIGGMGLTGFIEKVTFKLIEIQSSYINRKRIITTSLKETFNAFEKINMSENSVAWIDCLASGKFMGRGIIDYGDFSKDINVLQAHTKPFLNVPIYFPGFVLNTFSVKIFNKLYYALAKYKSSDDKQELVHYDSFFYPLDKILNWNKIYGKRGFIQYQFVIGDNDAYETILACLETISESGIGSFLCVLKKFGNTPSKGVLSFPRPGYTLALDMPMKKKTLDLVGKLNKVIKKNNGSIYLTKDSLLEDIDLIGQRDKIEAFLNIRKKYSLKYQSFQSKRLGI